MGNEKKMHFFIYKGLFLVLVKALGGWMFVFR